MEGRTTPSGDAVTAVLDFLPIFESPDFSLGRQRGGLPDEHGLIEWPWFEYSDSVQAFVRALYDHGWIVPFDWSSWHVEADWIIASGAIDHADLATLQRLLTLIVRKDRFVEGELAVAFESGLIVRILRRLSMVTQ